MIRYLFLFLALVCTAMPVIAEPIPVVASFSILGDLARQVGGDKVSVTTLVGPDADSHVYQPTPLDVKTITAAKVLVMNGMGFEGWMGRLKEAAGFKGTVVVVTEKLPHPFKAEKNENHQDDDHDHHHSVMDPHAWQDAKNAAHYVKIIAEGFSKVDPESAESYRANASRLVEEFMALDAWANTELGALPAGKRKLITSHDAFGYFARAYGLTLLAPVGLSTDAEPSAADIKKLIVQIKKDAIKALFIENMANPKLLQQIASETEAVIGGKLYADALSGADGPAASYQDMIKHNVTTIVTALKTGS